MYFLHGVSPLVSFHPLLAVAVRRQIREGQTEQIWASHGERRAEKSQPRSWINYITNTQVKRYIGLHEHISELRDITCHMGSDSVSCHPTQVNAPRLSPATRLVLDLPTPSGMEGWVDLGGWLHTEMMYLPADRQSPIQVLTGPDVE